VSDSKDVDLNIKFNANEVLSQIRQVDQAIANTQNRVNQLNRKASNNNGTISARDQANVAGQLGDSQEMLRAIQELSKVTAQTLDYQRANHADTSTVSNNQNVYKMLQDALDRGHSSIGYSQTTGNVNPNESFQQTQGYKTNASKAYSNYNDTDLQHERDELNRSMKDFVRSISLQVGNTSRSITRTSGTLDTTIRSGHMSGERYDKYNNGFATANENIKSTSVSIDDKIREYTGRRDQVQGRIDSINNNNAKGQYSRDDASEKAAATEQVKEIQKNIDSLRTFREQLDKASDTNKTNQNKLNTAVDSDAVGVDPYKNSLRGIINSRLPSIGRGAVAAGTATATGLVSSGSQARLQMEEQVNPIMYAQAQQNGVTKHADNTIENNLADISKKNGTNYKQTEMAQFASAYTGSTGNSNYQSGANNWSQFARYSGVSNDTALALENTVGQSGGGSDSAAVTHAIQNSITNSGMTAKANVQGQALNSLISNASNLNLSKTNIKDMAGFQGIMAKQGSDLQGQNGANALTATTKAVTNFNDPVARMWFGGNSDKYQGVDGQVKLMDDMQQAAKDPLKLNNPIARGLASNHGNVERTAGQLSQMAQANGQDLTVAQARKLINLQKNGQWTKKAVNDIVKPKGKSDKNKAQYDKSGVATINAKEAIIQAASIKSSQAMDTPRAIGNTLMGMSSGLTATMLTGGSIGASALQSIGGTAIGSMFQGKGEHTAPRGGRHMDKSGRFTSRVGSKIRSTASTIGESGIFKGATKYAKRAGGFLKNSRIGGFAVSVGTGILTHGKSLKSRTMQRFARNGSHFATKGATKEAESVATRATRFAKTSRASSLLSKGGSVLRGAGKIGGGALSAALAVGSIYTDLKTTKKGSKERHKAVGSSVGSGVGGTVGSVLGSALGPLGTIAGGAAGSWIGGKIGGFAGGLLPANNKKSVVERAKEKQKKDMKKFFGGDKDDKNLTKMGKSKNTSNNKKNDVLSRAKSLLKGFNDMLDKALKVIAAAKEIKGGDSNSDSDSNSDVTGTSGKGSEALKSIAKKVGKDLGVDPSYIYAQLALESADGTSKLSSHNNFGGIKYQSGAAGETKGSISPEHDAYAYFDSTDAFASKYEATLKSKGIQNSSSLEDFNNKLKAGGYYTDNSAHYLSMLKSKVKDYNAMGGVKLHSTGGMSIANQATYANGGNVYGEAGTEAYVPLNAGHFYDGMSTVNDLAGMFGKRLVDHSATDNSSNARNVSVSPSYNINIDASGSNGVDENKIKQVVMQALQSYTNDIKNQTTSAFFGNAFVQ
jgi:flagellum-specific peptidoglycan hydrolase FlgJ